MISLFCLNKCLMIGLQMAYSSPAESGIIEDLDISLAAVRTSNFFFFHLYIHFFFFLDMLIVYTFLVKLKHVHLS